MLLFCAKTIVKESHKFELARLKKKKKKKKKKKEEEEERRRRRRRRRRREEEDFGRLTTLVRYFHDAF